jgi:hypothetical protein
MILFSTAIKIGADTFLYKVYQNGFKAIVKVAEEAVVNLPIMYVPSSIESEFLQKFGRDLHGIISIKNETSRNFSFKNFYNWLLSTVKPAQA